MRSKKLVVSWVVLKIVLILLSLFHSRWYGRTRWSGSETKWDSQGEGVPVQTGPTG